MYVQGEFYDPTDEMRSEMSNVEATSVPIERMFAIKDYVTRTNSAQLSFHSNTALSTYSANDVHGWLQTLKPG